MCDTSMLFSQRGKTPLVVGGTGFYLKWFLNGKADTPRSTPEGEAAANNLLEEVTHHN